MSITPDRSRRLADVESAFRTLPERYLGADPGFDATYNIRLCDLGHTWEVRCTTHGARVRKGASRRAPDVTISTDAETWQALRAGEKPQLNWGVSQLPRSQSRASSLATSFSTSTAAST